MNGCVGFNCDGAPCGVGIELLHAQRDVYHMACERGARIRFQARREPDVSRDPYRSISSRPSVQSAVTIPAFPLVIRPDERVLERAGVKDPVDLMAHTPAHAWHLAGLTYADVDPIRWTAVYAGRVHRIVSRQLEGQFGSDWLYWVFSLVAD